MYKIEEFENRVNIYPFTNNPLEYVQVLRTPPHQVTMLIIDWSYRDAKECLEKLHHVYNALSIAIKHVEKGRS